MNIYKAIGYVRVSTDTQETQRQVDAIERYCQANNIDCPRIIHEPDGISGRSAAARKSPASALDYYRSLIIRDWDKIERPGYSELLASIQLAACTYDKITHVIFYALDRLSRDAIELLILEKIFAEVGCALVVVNSGGAANTLTANGWMQYAIQSIMAEFECRQISERTKSTLAVKAKTAKLGRPLVGWTKKDGKFVHAPELWATVEKVRNLRKKGRTYKIIAQDVGISVGMVKAYLKASTFSPEDK